MKPESFNQPRNITTVEKDVTSPEFREESGSKNEVVERSNKLARLALGALTFYGVADEAEMLVLRDAGASAFAAESSVLSESVSTGKVRLSSGEEITIPKPGDLFDRVMVYMPEGQAPDRLILLFSQTHRLSQGQLEGYTAEERSTALEEANESQRRLYLGIKQLINDGSLHSVCSEGNTVWDSTRADLRDYSEQGVRTTADILVNYFPGSDLEQSVKRANESYQQYYNKTGDIDGALSRYDNVVKNNPTFQQYIQKYKYIGGASRLLAAEGELIPCPGEDVVAADNLWSSKEVQRLWNTPRSAWTNSDYDLYQKVMFEDREDGAISTAMNSVPDDVIGLTYGAAHDFTNNVAEWNARNPDQQIGLVDIRAPYH